MATRQPRRNEWHQVNGKWARSLGARGIRVRLFQLRKSGTFYRDVWCPGAGKDRKSLHTGDRAEAERLGKELLAALLRGDSIQAPGPVTLQELLERYQAEAPMFLDNGDETKSDAKRRAYVLQAYFGARCDVRTMTENDVRAYTTKRLAGGIKCDDGFITKVVRVRSVECDLKLLFAALRWATTVRIGSGGRWLDRHPRDGVKIPRERNPLRPMTSIERFNKTREAAQNLACEATVDALRLRWVRVELALVLFEATGRRRGAVLQLAWDDIDFERHTIRWRAEGDKQRREWVVPMPVALADELRAFRRKLSAISGWLFPAERHATQPTHPDVLSAWIEQAERKAKLPKLRGGLLHPYRRKWATERKHLSVKDVAEAGGWRDVTTLHPSYQQPDLDTMLAVMSEPTKVTESATVQR